jgi:hypothetical protein
MRTGLLMIPLVTTTVVGGCASEVPSPPYKAAATLEQLMEGPVAHAADVYWDSVQTIVDETGIHDQYPKTDEEWEGVWASALTIAESGNLLMMPSHAKDNGEWMAFASRLVDVGMEAAQAAESKDREKVLDVGGRMYIVCTECHTKYIPED